MVANPVLVERSILTTDHGLSPLLGPLGVATNEGPRIEDVNGGAFAPDHAETLVVDRQSVSVVYSLPCTARLVRHCTRSTPLDPIVSRSWRVFPPPEVAAPSVARHQTWGPNTVVSKPCSATGSLAATCAGAARISLLHSCSLLLTATVAHGQPPLSRPHTVPNSGR